MFKSLILSELKKQKEALAIPYEAIASRAGVGIATVKRAFSGHDISLDTLDKIAVALGCEIAIKPKQSPKALYQAQIEKKAQEIVNRVVKTSALENQTPSIEAQKKMLIQAKAMIAKMPKSRVWA
ncbi:helix-turn-helix domain-containing protein [Sulfuricurvum sp.]|uniref:helix-turn-helix domain-containing protein n=1 Tax=Sulfuricurvum sp. TaxID=2025608 RepID=UPI00263201C2|nr:helix-turn-helix domain-containing protein [Sulfuricurvum sp.]MDD2267565.1 helix-turn-helix domain-containing protein [Sulfuricurvum sp.]MDD2783738.1 helix-turn-helix domain-containing protein [Sulfuricurvum sp.]